MAERTLTGVGVSPGRGAAPVVIAPARVPPPGPGPTGGANPGVITAAAEQVRRELEDAARRTTGEARALLEATAMMATDPALVVTAEGLLADDVGPARAVWEAATRIVDDLRSLGGAMAERAWDVIDVRDRVMAVLTGRTRTGVPDPGHPYVLVATDLSPVDVAMLDPSRTLAIVTARGGPVSHTVILARALGIPTVVGVHGATGLAVGSLVVVVVDGGAGTVTVDASPEEVEVALATRPALRTFTGDGRTSDGHRVPLLADLGRPEDARVAADAGAEGVGQLRTEFCYLGRRQPPSHEDQVEAYRRVFAAFAGRTVVVRTLDAGSDNPLPFLTSGEEPNPALGVRGLRTSVDHPQLLDVQLAAIAAAADAEDAEVWVMAPMVTTPADADEFTRRCTARGLPIAGVTIQLPAAALRAGQILARAAFGSVGTDELTQYTMAADRRLPELAHLSTPWQPAVLELIGSACRGGAQLQRPVGVCGEAAADPALAVVLVGLGASSLSMGYRALADVAAVLSRTTLAECRELAEVALAADSAEEARRSVRAGLPLLTELGL